MDLSVLEYQEDVIYLSSPSLPSVEGELTSDITMNNCMYKDPWPTM